MIIYTSTFEEDVGFFSTCLCARGPVDRALASGAESAGSTPAGHTINVNLYF